MYNWNTDTTKFKTAEAKRVWELVQLLEYGVRDEKLSRRELKAYWPKIKQQLDPAVKRLLEYVLWGKLYSLETNNSFWIKSLPLQKLSTLSILPGEQL